MLASVNKRRMPPAARFQLNLLIQTSGHSVSLKAMIYVKQIDMAIGAQTAIADYAPVQFCNPKRDPGNPFAPAGQVRRPGRPGRDLLRGVVLNVHLSHRIGEQRGHRFQITVLISPDNHGNYYSMLFLENGGVQTSCAPEHHFPSNHLRNCRAAESASVSRPVNAVCTRLGSAASPASSRARNFSESF